MLGDNIRELRKQKGYSQETFAQKLHVVRQTVSKWEKGYSVPDAETLKVIAELLDTSVSDLLGGDVKGSESNSGPKEDDIAKQLAILNDQLADRFVRRRKMIKRILLGIVVVIALIIVLLVINVGQFKFRPEMIQEESVVEEHYYVPSDD